MHRQAPPHPATSPGLAYPLLDLEPCPALLCFAHLQVKSNELKVLEDQTRMFEKEMNQLTKTIHTLQGDTQHDVAGNTDYQVRGPQLR